MAVGKKISRRVAYACAAVVLIVRAKATAIVAVGTAPVIFPPLRAMAVGSKLVVALGTTNIARGVMPQGTGERNLSARTKVRPGSDNLVGIRTSLSGLQCEREPTSQLYFCPHAQEDRGAGSAEFCRTM